MLDLIVLNNMLLVLEVNHCYTDKNDLFLPSLKDASTEHDQTSQTAFLLVWLDAPIDLKLIF